MARITSITTAVAPPNRSGTISRRSIKTRIRFKNSPASSPPQATQYYRIHQHSAQYEAQESESTSNKEFIQTIFSSTFVYVVSTCYSSGTRVSKRFSTRALCTALQRNAGTRGARARQKSRLSRRGGRCRRVLPGRCHESVSDRRDMKGVMDRRSGGVFAVSMALVVALLAVWVVGFRVVVRRRLRRRTYP